MSKAPMPRVGDRWRFKPSRGAGTFTVVSVNISRVGLRSTYDGRTKTISLRTLRCDYEKAERSTA